MDARELPLEMIRSARQQSMLLQGLASQTLREHGLSYNQLQILMELDDAVTMSVGRMCDTLGMHESTLMNELRVLERRGLVERQRSVRERRAKQLRLTLDGRQTMGSIDRELGEVFFMFMAAMPRDIFEAVISGVYAMRLFMRGMAGEEVRLLPGATVSSDQLDDSFNVGSDDVDEVVAGILSGATLDDEVGNAIAADSPRELEGEDASGEAPLGR